jgi:hypothetical protein
MLARFFEWCAETGAVVSVHAAENAVWLVGNAPSGESRSRTVGELGPPSEADIARARRLAEALNSPEGRAQLLERGEWLQ